MQCKSGPPLLATLTFCGCTFKRFSTYLVNQIPVLQLDICTDLLVNRPCKFLVQLPSDDSETQRAYSSNDRKSNEIRPDVGPEILLDELQISQLLEGVVDLIALYGCVDKNGHVHGHDADDLNGVLRAESIVHEQQLVHEAENEEGEVGWDSLDVGASLC